MKELNYTELKKAPTIIQYIYAAMATQHPVGQGTFEDSKKKYPEYFEKELNQIVIPFKALSRLVQMNFTTVKGELTKDFETYFNEVKAGFVPKPVEFDYEARNLAKFIIEKDFKFNSVILRYKKEGKKKKR